MGDGLTGLELVGTGGTGAGVVGETAGLDVTGREGVDTGVGVTTGLGVAGAGLSGTGAGVEGLLTSGVQEVGGFELSSHT